MSPSALKGSPGRPGVNLWKALRWEDRYRRFVYSARDAIFLAAADGTILSLNPAFEAITGWPGRDWLGKSLGGLIDPEDVSPVLAALRRAAAGDPVPLFEARVRHGSGGTLRFECLVTPEVADDGEIAALGIARDVTRLRATEEALGRAQAQLRQAQKMDALGRLAAEVAHDFNNDLAVILGCGEMLLARLTAAPDRAIVTEIVKGGVRAASLTRRLLSFSRKEAPRPQVLDPNAVVAGLTVMLRRLLGERVELVTVLEPGLGRIKADVGQLEHVVVNLVVNARDAMPAGGTLLVRTANVLLEGRGPCPCPELPPGPYVALSFADNGSGMDEATRAHLFEPFFTTKGPGKGTGLGLATAAEIVRQGNGAIRVESELGRGTVMTIYLRQTEEPLAPRAVLRDDVAPEFAAATVLIVEEEEVVRSLASQVLRSAGYVVLEAAGEDEAVRHCQGHEKPIHLLLSHVVMPQVVGSELAARLGALRPEMRVLFMSGHPDVVRTDLPAGRYATAPAQFSPTRLLRQVSEMLEEGAGRREARPFGSTTTGVKEGPRQGVRLVTDALWERIRPLLPPTPRRVRSRGRRPLDCRQVLTGILHVLTTGISWAKLPREMDCGSGTTCQNYLKAWQQAGVWPRMQEVLAAELTGGDKIDWSRALIEETKKRVRCACPVG